MGGASGVGAEPAAGGVSARDWSSQLQVIWSLELGLPDRPRDSPGAASGAPFWPPARVCGTDPSCEQFCLGSGEGSPTLRKGLRRHGAAELCGHEGQSHPCA